MSPRLRRNPLDPLAPLKKRKESEIKREILRYLRTLPEVFIVPMNVGAVRGTYGGKERFVQFGVKGMPDLIGWRREYLGNLRHGYHYIPRWLAIEVKTPKGKVTDAQFNFLGAVAGAGGLACVARSVEDVRRLLAPTQAEGSSVATSVEEARKGVEG